MALPRDPSALLEAQDVLGGSFRAIPDDDERAASVDPRVLPVSGPPQGSSLFGQQLDPDERTALTGELPMRQARVKTRVVDPETQEEDFEDEVQYGVDLRELRNRLTRAMVTSELNRRRGSDPNYEPTSEEKGELEKTMRQEAHRKLIQRIQQSNNENYIFIDDDPEGVLEDLQKHGGLPEPLANVIKAASPEFLEKKILGTTGLIGAWLHGRGGRTYQPTFDEATGEWKVAEKELAEREGVLGALEFIGQPAPSTYVATAIAAGIDREKKGEVDLVDLPVVRQIHAYLAGEQEEEQIERVRAGEDMFTYSGEIGAFVTPFVDDPDGFFATVIGAGLSFGVALVEPDLVSVATFGMGKAARGVKALHRTGQVVGKTLPMADKWSVAGKLDKTSQVSAVWASRIREAVETGADPEAIASLERQAAREIHNLNPHLNFMLQSRLRATTSMGENGDARVNNALLYALSQRKLGATTVEEASGTVESYLRRREAVTGAEHRLSEADAAYRKVLAENPEWAGDFEIVSTAYRDVRWELALAHALLRRDPDVTADLLKGATGPRKASLQALGAKDEAALRKHTESLRDTYKKLQKRRRQMLTRLGKDLSSSLRSAETAATKASVTVDLRRAAADHYAEVAVLEHMKAMRRGFDKLSQRRPKAVDAGEASALTKTYQEAMEAYADSQRRLIAAKSPDEIVAAQQAMYEANIALRKITLKGADHIAAKGFGALDDAIETAATRAKDAEGRLMFWTEVAKGANLSPGLGKHSRALRGLRSIEFRASRERLVARAYADSLEHISEQYGRLADRMRSGDLEKINLTKASKAIGAVIKTGGRAEVKDILRVAEDVFGPEAVDQLLAAASVPERLLGFAEAFRAARAGQDGTMQLERSAVHDLVSSLRSLRNAAKLEGTETAVATEMRKITQAGLDELIGADVPSDVDTLQDVYRSLSAAGIAGDAAEAGVIRKHLGKILGQDALAAAARARAKAEAAGEAVDKADPLQRIIDATGEIVLKSELPRLVTTLNGYRRGLVEAKALSRVKRVLVSRMRSAARMLRRTALTLTDPAAAKLGMLFDEENLIQVGKGVIDHSKVVQREIVEIASAAAEPTERAARMRRYITDPRAAFEGFRAVGHAALGNKSLWDGAALLWKGMTKAEVQNDDLLRALSRIWVKDGTVMPDVGETALMSAAVRLIEEAKLIDDEGVRRLALSFDEFERAMLAATVELEQVHALTGRLVRHRRGEEVRAMGYAAQLIGAAASIQRATDTMSLRMVGVTEETVHNVRRFLENNEGAINEGFDEVYQLFARMGLPPKTIEQASAIGKKFERGILAIRDSEGRLGAFPYEWHHHIVKEVQPLMKRWMEVSERTKDTLPVRVWEFMGTMMRIWRTSVTSGVMVISPRYLASNSFGLISQIGLEDRFRTAFKAIAQGGAAAAMESWPVQAMRKVLPEAMGRAIDEPYLRALDANSGNAKGLLGSITNAIYNPCISAVYDTRRFGDDATLPGPHGVKMGQLRTWLIEQGVLTSQASENMMEIMSRASRLSNESRKWTLPWLASEVRRGYKADDPTTLQPGGIIGAAKAFGAAGAKFWSAPVKHLDERGQVIAGLADAVEQRQRVALYTDLVVNRGMHPEEAGRVVREAAYDWNHAGTEDEAKLLGPLVLFYRAMKLMYRQGIRHAFDPFIRGFRGESPKVVGGSIAKLRGLEGTTENIGEYYVGAMYDLLDYEKDVLPLKDTNREAYDARLAEWQMQQSSPWWLAGGQRMWMGSSVLSEEQRTAAQAARGKPATHIATTMPSHTVLEFVGHVYASGMGLAALATGRMTPGEAARRVGTSLAELGGPGAGEGIQAVVDAFLGTSPGAYRGDPNRLVPLRAHEQVLAEHFPDMLHAQYDPEKNAWEVPSHVATRLRLTPVLGTELLNYGTPIADIRAGMVPEEDSAAAYYLRQVSGLGRTYPFDPAKELENKSKYSIESTVKEAEKRAGGKTAIAEELGAEPGKTGRRHRLSRVERVRARRARRRARRQEILESRRSRRQEILESRRSRRISDTSP